MKVEPFELRKSFGEIRVIPESLDDLWHLEHLVRPGDLVYATTFRSPEAATDKIRPEKLEKRPVRLGVRVEKVEFHRNANRLRISGLIEEGVDAGFYHSINIDTGYDLSIIRKWNERDLERLSRAEKAGTGVTVHILSLEEGEAELFRIRQFGPEKVAECIAGSGKREGGGRSAFFGTVAGILDETTGPVVIAGPGFVKDEFFEFLKTTHPQVAERSIRAETRRIGRGAVQDAIAQGVLQRITEDLQLEREVKYMEEFLRRIGTDGTAAYGIAEVERSIEWGATKTILVTDTMLRTGGVEELLERAEGMGAEIVVFSTDFDPGAQLESLGGIAALLRFAIEK